MCIVGIRERAPDSSLKPLLTIQERAGALAICITGLPVPAHTEEVLCEYSRSPLVKCLFTGLKPLVIHHTLEFFPFNLSNKNWKSLLTMVLE